METIKDYKNFYIDTIGMEYTSFVTDNYKYLSVNYDKLPAKKKKIIKFPIFCFLIFRNTTIDDINYRINEN